MNKLGLTQEIVASGDSLTEGTGSTSGYSYPEQLSTMLGNTLVLKPGIGGQTIEQIASRQGALPIYVTISGNALAGASAVSITSISSNFISGSSTQDRFSTGILCGVPGVIKRTVVSSVETYVFLPCNYPVNTTKPIPANSIFYPDFSNNWKHSINIFWWARNNVATGLIGLDSIYEKAIDLLESPKRYLIIGVLNASTEPSGTNLYNNIIAFNNILRSKYKGQYIEATPPTVEEMNYIKYTPTTQDNTDIASGFFPTGMRTDNVHLNNIGYQIFALRAYRGLKSNQYS